MSELLFDWVLLLALGGSALTSPRFRPVLRALFTGTMAQGGEVPRPPSRHREERP